MIGKNYSDNDTIENVASMLEKESKKAAEKEKSDDDKKSVKSDKKS